MNAETKIAPGTDIVVVDEPRALLIDKENFTAWLVQTKANVEGLDADMSTKKNRDATRSAAAKIAGKKAEIDRARLGLTKEMRDRIDVINADGKSIKEKLEALQANVRAPLDAWEAAEDARIERCKAIIADIHGAAIVTMDDTSETVRERGMRIWAIEIGDDFGDRASEAEQAKSATVSTLQAALKRLLREEADAIELAKLRAIQAAREEADRIAAEQAEAARIEALRVEEERVAAERAETARLAKIEADKEAARTAEEQRLAQIEQARKDAAEQTQRDAEMAAQADRDRIQAEHETALAVERKRADDLAAAEAERIEKDRVEAAEKARKEKNRAHRQKFMGESKLALMGLAGFSEETAILVVQLITRNQIPHLVMEF